VEKRGKDYKCHSARRVAKLGLVTIQGVIVAVHPERATVLFPVAKALVGGLVAAGIAAKPSQARRRKRQPNGNTHTDRQESVAALSSENIASSSRVHRPSSTRSGAPLWRLPPGTVSSVRTGTSSRDPGGFPALHRTVPAFFRRQPSFKGGREPGRPGPPVC